MGYHQSVYLAIFEKNIIELGINESGISINASLYESLKAFFFESMSTSKGRRGSE